MSETKTTADEKQKRWEPVFHWRRKGKKHVMMNRCSEGYHISLMLVKPNQPEADGSIHFDVVLQNTIPSYQLAKQICRIWFYNHVDIKRWQPRKK